jgi:hypothetical protein
MLIVDYHTSMLKYGPEGKILVTSQTLAEITGFPYGKIRRHVKETFPRDVRATLQSGYAREYSLQDGYYIFLVVHLVASLKITAPEVKIILESVRDWLTEKGLFPGEDERRWLDPLEFDSREDGYEIQIMRETGGVGFCCLAIKRLKKEVIEEPGTYREEYSLEKIAGSCDDVDELNIRFLKVSDLKRKFLIGFDRYSYEGGTRRGRPKKKKKFGKR